jgi:hypothetical protein
MSGWEKQIIEAFVKRYFISAAKTGGEPSSLRSSAGGSGTQAKNTLRLRSASIFADFDASVPDEKESFLEAAELLEQRGLLNLTWEKRGKGEKLKTFYCPDMAKLFRESGQKDPQAEAQEIRSLFAQKASALGEESFLRTSRNTPAPPMWGEAWISRRHRIC